MVSGECTRAGLVPRGRLSSRCDGHDETGNDFLTYLDPTDEQLLERLDDELKLDAVKRLRSHTSALREGSVSPDHVMRDWYQLVPAFVAAHGAEEPQELEGAAGLTEADRAHLTVLEAWLDKYPEMRTTGA
jgi:hypothetical protein